jgi:hypothetical protein
MLGNGRHIKVSMADRRVPSELCQRGFGRLPSLLGLSLLGLVLLAFWTQVPYFAAKYVVARF